jgi:Flp pilus assembly protein protease CpaA
MIFEVILASVTLVVILVASYSDLRWREVPDWLSYGLIFSALAVRGIFSFIEGWEVILAGALGFVICFLIACLFYYSNQWGGGDSKLLMGMGAVIGITYPFQASSWNLLWFFLLLLCLGAIYGLLWVLGLAVKDRKRFWPEFKSKIYEYKTTHLILGIISLLIFVLFLFGLKYNFSFVWPLVPFPLATFYLFLFVTTVENTCFVMKREVTKLTEGDWLAEEIKINNQILIKKKTLEKEDLDQLLKLHKEGKLSKVTVREGVPFIPSFFFAYVTFLILGYYSYFVLI